MTWAKKSKRGGKRRTGAHYDPDSPVIWKQYIIGPVPLWRRVLRTSLKVRVLD